MRRSENPRDRSITRRDALQSAAGFAGVIALASRTAAAGSPLVVDADNDPSDDGDGDRSFRSIQAAVDAAAPGETIRVKPGRYHESVVITTDDLTLTGQPGNASTRGPGDDAPILDGEGENSHAFRVGGSVSGVTIEGFEVTNYGFTEPSETHPAGTGVRAGRHGSPATDLVVRNNYLHTLGAAGVRIKGGVDCLVARNVVRDVAAPFEEHDRPDGLEFAFGITFANNRNSTVADNLVTHGDPEGETTGSAETTGIRIKAIGDDSDGRPVSEGVDVIGNDVRGAFTVSSITVNTSPGEGSRAVRDTTIAQNVITGSANSGIDTFLSGDEPEISGLVVRENEIRGNATGGIVFGPADGGRYRSIEIRSNTIAENSRTGLAIPRGVPLEEATIADNVLRATAPAGGVPGVGIVVATADLAGELDIQRNDISTNGGGIGVPEPDVPTDKFRVNWNNISDNERVGLFNAGAPTIDAERNWWGATNGPERDAGRSGRTVGDGDRVSDHVDFKPWRPQEI